MALLTYITFITFLYDFVIEDMESKETGIYTFIALQISAVP
ncbi:hypothetical protein [Methylotuvimicrobium sp. KM2]